MKAIVSIGIVMALFAGSCCNSAKKTAQQSDIAITATENKSACLPALNAYIEEVESSFNTITGTRKAQLQVLSDFVSNQKEANLIFICTHNSRRSHMSQLWAQTAARYYGIDNVHCYSGGTEATAFNPRSVKALRHAGFDIQKTDESTNPVYLVRYAENEEALKGFSKKYDDPFNPQDHFVAVMTCSDADEKCPIVVGADLRVALPYEDPKVADDTPEEEARYNERCKQIATEMCYVFSQVRENIE